MPDKKWLFECYEKHYPSGCPKRTEFPSAFGGCRFYPQCMRINKRRLKDEAAKPA